MKRILLLALSASAFAAAVRAAFRRRCRSLGYSMAEKLTELLADLPPTPHEVELTAIAADEEFAKGECP